MAGSSHSGQDMEAGRTNRAENRTIIWAQRESDGDFDGDAIFIVEAAGDIEDDDFKLVNDGIAVHGVRASGTGSGAGVLGLNRRHPVDQPGEELSPIDIAHTHSVGVFGKGATGVVGQGDLRGVADQHIVDGRGVGIIGRGDHGLVSAPGVVGFAGGVTGETIDSGTGVFGQGGIGVSGQGMRGPGVKGTGSPEEAGVLGIGGKEHTDQAKQGPGVVGIGHGNEVSVAFASAVETGVFGLGQDGVKGVGIGGRGGVFQSDRAAQVHLVPAQGPQMPEQVSFIPTVAADPGRAGAPLPRTGRAGDLVSVVDDRGRCTLWFCVQSGEERAPARWSQVLLGPSFDGRT
jgi:hypothetical protein